MPERPLLIHRSETIWRLETIAADIEALRNEYRSDAPKGLIDGAMCLWALGLRTTIKNLRDEGIASEPRQEPSGCAKGSQSPTGGLSCTDAPSSRRTTSEEAP